MANHNNSDILVETNRVRIVRWNAETYAIQGKDGEVDSPGGGYWTTGVFTGDWEQAIEIKAQIEMNIETGEDMYSNLD